MVQRIFTLCVAALAAFITPALAQVTGDSPLNSPPNGPRVTAPGTHVVIADHVHRQPGADPVRAAIVITDGRIAEIIPLPEQGQGEHTWTTARVMDMGSAHIYAGFIDAHQPIDTPRPDSKSPGAHWSEQVTPQRIAAAGPSLSNADKQKLHKLGFTVAAIAPEGGNIAGQSAVVSLAPAPSDSSIRQPLVYRNRAYHTISLATAGWGSRSYPSSQMGAISLIRQTFYDAKWVNTSDSDDEVAGCLIELNNDLPLVFRTQDELEVLRAGKLAAEFDRPFMVVGTGTEFRRLNAIAQLAESNKDNGFAVIAPLTLPRKPDVSSVGHAEEISLAALMTWEQAPTNLRRLQEAGVRVALTTSGMRSDESFSRNMTEALKVGLEPAAALAMLTTNPAQALGIEDQLGTIDPGKRAHLVVASGDLFDVKAREDKKNPAKILDLWIDGQQYVIDTPTPPNLDGEWSLVANRVFDLTMIIKDGAVTLKQVNDKGETVTTKGRNTKITHEGAISFLYDAPQYSGATVLTGLTTRDGSIKGTGISPRGTTFNWTATRKEDANPDADVADESETDDTPTFAGEWDALLSDEFKLSLIIEREKGKADAPDTWTTTVKEITSDSRVITQPAESTTHNDDKTLTIVFDHTPFGDAGSFTLIATLTENDTLTGNGTTGTGAPFTFTATRTPEDTLPPQDLPGYPFGAYAMSELPEQGTVLFRSATIWTQSDAGVIEEGDLLIENGKIAYVGPSKDWAWKAGEEPRIITMRRRHITPGLIDAHSHTGISRGVNESGQAVTAEVRIADVTDPDDIDWYRQLAGGVTIANSMHGSANPIGGQTQTVKVRWGVSNPDDMHMEDAKPGIKFALGENVKQSNWGADFNTRYPQTRMGVETIMRDRFLAAQEYANTPEDQRRRDLELDAMHEILMGDRLIHCHSYRQDEILMLCLLADEFKFKIGTFQHGLEVYKVAEHVKKHAIGASIFSDWWAFKVEVQDAIVYAGPLQAEVGVLTSYNSDSNELARRMAAEAAKAYKYAEGRMSREEALDFVTLNPAIQLGIADRVGSLEVGKDADLAVWSGDPLSTFTRCLSTWIDGREYYSQQRDAQLREQNAQHRTRIIQKLLGKPKDQPKTEKAPKSDSPSTDEAESPESIQLQQWLAAGLSAHDITHAQEDADALRDATLDLIRLGKDPAGHRCGDCGTTHIHLSNLQGESHR